MEKIIKYEYLLFYFSVIDILFAPYVSFVAVTYSQFPIFIWFLFKAKTNFNNTEVKLYYLIITLIVLSVIFSVFYIPDGLYDKYIIENIKRATNIILAISYYFFFKYILSNLNISLNKILIYFIIYVSLWGVLYYIDSSTFIYIKNFFNPRDATLGFINLYNDYFLRFNFIWTDPNNLGYALVGIVSYLILSHKTKIHQIFLIIFLLVFNLLIIMSAGSILVALFIIPFSALLRLKSTNSIKYVFISIFLIIILFFTISIGLNKFYNSDIGIRSSARLEEKSVQGDTRGTIWLELINNKNILTHAIIGEGPTIFVDNNPYSPHNGHFVFIFGYGLICYLGYLYLIFRKEKRHKLYDYLYTIPFLICFTVNIGIGEAKFAGLMYLIYAWSRTNIIKNIT